MIMKNPFVDYKKSVIVQSPSYGSMCSMGSITYWTSSNPTVIRASDHVTTTYILHIIRTRLDFKEELSTPN